MASAAPPDSPPSLQRSCICISNPPWTRADRQAGRSAAPLHLTKAIWHEAPFGSSSAAAAAAFPLNCSNQVEGGGKTEGSEAPEGTVPRGHYPPVGAAVRAVVRRERDVTGRLEDE